MRIFHSLPNSSAIRREGGGGQRRDAVKHGGDFGDPGVQPRFVLRPDLHQQGRDAVAKATDFRRHARLVLDRPQRRPVHQLDGGDRRRLKQRHGAAGFADAGEEQQGAGLVGMLGHGAVGDLGDEAQRAFRADHQVLEDFQRVFEIDQRVDAVAGGVLDRELVADALRQHGIGAGRAAKLVQLGQQVAVAGPEAGDAVGISGIHQRAVGQQQAHGHKRLVAVVRRAAAHARRVVGGDAADLGAVDGSRVRADLAGIACQPPVGIRPQHSRLKPDQGAGLFDLTRSHLSPSIISTLSLTA